MHGKRKGRLLDKRGMLIALAFIALMYADVFLGRGWLSGLIVGGAFSVIGLTLVIENMLMIRVGRWVMATVVEHQEKSSDDEIHYIPVVEFSDRYGKRQRKRTDTGYGVKKPSVGTRVRVRYDPSEKLACQIMSASRWVIPVALLAAGALVLGLTVAQHMK